MDGLPRLEQVQEIKIVHREHAIGAGVWLLVQFLHRHLRFRVAELEALAAIDGWSDGLEIRAPEDCDGYAQSHWIQGGVVCGFNSFRDMLSRLSPYWYVRFPSEEAARKVCQRAILIKRIYGIWGEGDSLDSVGRSNRDDNNNTTRTSVYICLSSIFKYGRQQRRRDDMWRRAPVTLRDGRRPT